MGTGRGKSAGSQKQGPVATKWIHVTGTLNVDATCNYKKTGIHNGKDYYRRLDGAWYIWWNDPDWNITPNLGGFPMSPYWTRTSPDIIGDYQPQWGGTGIARTTYGKH